MIRRPFVVIFYALACSHVAGLTGAATPLLAKAHLGVDPEVLGSYGFTTMSIFAVSAWTIGRLGGRFRRKSVLRATLIGLLIAEALLVVVNSPLTLYIPTALLGAAMGSFWPTVEATMCDGQTPRQIKRATGFFNTAWMFGMSDGALVGGALYDVHPRAPYLLALVLLSLMFLLLHLPRSLEIVGWGRAEHFEQSERVSPRKRLLFVKLSLLANAIFLFGLSGYRGLLAEWAVEVDISGWRYGLLLFGLNIGQLITNGVLVLWHGWHYSVRFLLGMQAVGVALLVALGLVDHYTAFLALAVALGIPAGLCYFSAIYYGLEQGENDAARSERHSANHEAVIGLGACTGPLLGGWVIALADYSRAQLFLGAVVIALGILVQGLTVARRLGRGREFELPHKHGAVES